MSIFESIAKELYSLKEIDKVYVRFDPINTELKISSVLNTININLNMSSNDLGTFAHMLNKNVFNENKTVMSYDIKTLFKYIKFNVHPRFKDTYNNIKCQLFDIKYGEALSGIKIKSPGGFNEASERLEVFKNDPRFNLINNKIFIPLATKVLPKMESIGVIDLSVKDVVYPNYEIEGQVNGRLKCPLSHHLDDEMKSNLNPRPIDEEYVFVELDYSNCEGHILAWLSQDESLIEDAKSNDLYERMYYRLFNKECSSTNDRTLVKVLFIMLIYGAQPPAVAEKLKISIEEANGLCRKFVKEYYACMKWLLDKQNQLKSDNIAIDHFGRKRKFETEFYKRRNFEIQSPASIFCLEKLVRLHKYLNNYIVFNIHDSYVLACPLNSSRRVMSIAKRILEAPSELCDGITLKVNCKVGKNLFNMEKQ